MGELAMHTEVADQAGRNLAAEGMAAAGALREIRNRRLVAEEMIRREALPDGSAIHGLAVLVPVALVLWATIGMLVWAMVR
jgi:hypothetical protein